MSNPTSNYSFQMPTSTDLVTDLPADFEVFGQAVDTQMKTNADAAIAKSLVTTKGDLIAATGASTPARLAVGTNDQVLIADSTAATGIKWGTPSSGGMTLISETTASALSTLSLSSIPQTYKHLVLIWGGISHSAASTNFDIRFNADSGSNYSQNRVIHYGSGSGTGNCYGVGTSLCSVTASGGQNFFAFGSDNNSITAYYDYDQGAITIYNYATAKHKNVSGFTGGNNSAYDRWKSYIQCTYTSTTAISSIDITRISGTATFSNVANTSIRLYGVS